MIRSARQNFSFPSIIKLNTYVKIPYRHVEVSRKNIFKRDKHTCQYCGAKGSIMTVDHILPRSRGGMETWENLATACFRCNNIKGDRTPSEAGMKLMNKPSKPSYIMFISNGISQYEENWRQFMFF